MSVLAQETNDEIASARRATTRLAWALWLLGMVIAAAGLVLLALNRSTSVPESWGFRGFQTLNNIPIVSVGALISWRRPRNPIGWLILASGLFGVLAGFSEEYATYALLTRPDFLPGGKFAGLGSILWLPSMGLLGIHAMLLFPNGRLLTPRWRSISWLGAFWILIGVFRFAIQPGPLSEISFVVNPIGIEALETRLPWLAFPIYPIVGVGFLLMFVSAISLILRFWKADGKVRQQLKWLAFVSILIPLSGVVGFFQGVVADSLVLVFAMSLPVAMGIAILRYQLYDIDFLINRTLVYGALIAFIVSVNVLIVGTVGTVLHSQGNWAVTLLATGFVAVLFQPLRERLQRSVNRLVYGQRYEPFEVVAQLGRRLESTFSPDLVLPTVVETIAQALKLPYVAVTIKNSDGMETAVSCGEPVTIHKAYSLTHQGEVVGQLLVAQRTPNDAFSEVDERLLRNVARQAGAAAHAARLTADLRRSRQRLVTTREEERRRLRRDLHDGLGPVLASQGLKIAAAGKLLDSDLVQARQMLEDLASQNEATVAEIRQLVYGLRPPALDELGLVGAIRDYAAGLNPGVGQASLVVNIHEPENGLSSLPAAIEVAAYRITIEALTNVSRHSQAQHSAISFLIETDNGKQVLFLEIEDNGMGLPPKYKPGVGLGSMRERAEELGGKLQIESIPSQGTKVIARLPLGE